MWSANPGWRRRLQTFPAKENTLSNGVEVAGGTAGRFLRASISSAPNLPSFCCATRKECLQSLGAEPQTQTHSKLRISIQHLNVFLTFALLIEAINDEIVQKN